MSSEKLRESTAAFGFPILRITLFVGVSLVVIAGAVALRGVAVHGVQSDADVYGRDLAGAMAAAVHSPEITHHLADAELPTEWVVVSESARRNERVNRVGLMIGIEPADRRWVDLYAEGVGPASLLASSSARQAPDLVAREECIRDGLRQPASVIVWRDSAQAPRWVAMAPVRSAPLGQTLGLLWIEFTPQALVNRLAQIDQWFWAATLLSLALANGMTFALFRDGDSRLLLAGERRELQLQGQSLARARAEAERAAAGLRDRDREMGEQLALAREIQHSFLPREFPFGQQLRCAVAYEACPGIGGDLFDFFAVGPRTVGFYIADASGSGVSAAMVSALFKFTFERWNSMLVPAASDTDNTVDDDSAVRFERQARRFLAALNISLSDILNKRMFVTFLMGLMDVETGEVLFLNAGHQPPIIWRTDATRLEEINLPANIPLGVVADFAFDAGYARLRPGDKMLLYTDGITERMDARDREFGQHNLNQVFRANAHKSPELILASIRLETNNFGGQRGADDDQAMVLVEYLGPPGHERPPDQLRGGLVRARR